jgi:N-methylhydantoinase A
LNSPRLCGTVTRRQTSRQATGTIMVYLGVDTGGTFTDFVAVGADGQDLVSFKIPSVPGDPARAVAAGIERLRERHGIRPGDIGRLMFGTTVATNAVLEGKGARTALIATRGTRDVIEIQRLWRQRLFDLYLRRAAPLVPRRWRFEVDERIAADGSTVLPLTDAEAERIAGLIAGGGFEAVAICCLFGFLTPNHERRIRDAIARRCPDLPLSISSEVSPQFREYERATTTVMNAYVMPAVGRLVSRLETLLGEAGCAAPLRIIQSNGGLMSGATARRQPVRTLLSGPAGGVVGALRLASLAGLPDVITMDMGGTSLDICVLQGARVNLSSEGRIGPYPVQVPQVDVHTIGAGGGSIARCISGSLKVGPESAGAVPGPACYGRGGSEPTSTDAALVLGYIDPDYFAGGEMTLDADAARRAIEAGIATPLGMSVEQAAEAVVTVQVANMVTGIRAVSVQRGLDARDFALLPFGGAGALYAGRVAEQLGIRTLIIPIQPGVLSALGMLLTDITHTAVTTRVMDGAGAAGCEVAGLFAGMQADLAASLADDGVTDGAAHYEFLCDMRYRGQAYEVAVTVAGCEPGDCDPAALCAEFHRRHRDLYGQAAEGEAVEMVNFRVVANGRLARPDIAEMPPGPGAPPRATQHRPTHHAQRGWLETPVYPRASLGPGARLQGPAVIEEPGATVVLGPDHALRVDAVGNLLVTLPAPGTPREDTA